MTEKFQRSFSSIELEQIKQLKVHMSKAINVEDWNHIRNEAKKTWPEKIISAVDGLRKWIVSYNKSTKQVSYEPGVKF
jgi:hypothetical protein